MKWFFNPLEFIKSCTFYLGGGDEPAYVPITPANVSTGFGTAVANPESGQYSYTLDPRLAQMRDLFYNATNQFQPTAEEQQFASNISNTGMSTFGRGNELLNQALGLDTNQIGTDYYRQIQNILAPDRAEEETRLADTLFKSGRTGAAVGAQGGYLNPEQFALLKARERANQELAVNAAQYGRQQREGDTRYATGLMDAGLTAYGAGQRNRLTPYQTMATLFGLGTNIEGLGGNTLTTAMSALPYQQAQQAQAQAYENARAENSGGFLDGVLGNLVNAGLNYATGGLSSGFQAAGGVNPFSSIGASLGGIFSGTPRPGAFGNYVA